MPSPSRQGPTLPTVLVDLDATSTSTVVVMSWSIVEVARHAGVSSRTLRHYDDVGLVPPAYVGGNGYRYYEQEQLLRLQEVLLLRELGLPLDAIGRVLDGTDDRVAVLREHHAALLLERDRIDRLATTVARTIEMREGGDHMTPEELFEGFDAGTQREYEAELVERFGPRRRGRSRSRGAGSDG